MGQATLIPGLRYTDGPAAIEFLTSAFGFERQLVVPGEAGTIAHAQLVLGDAMIMLGSQPSAELEAMLARPSDVGGRVTHTIYVKVPDPDAHYARAVASGAAIVRDIADQSFGGRAYVCRDPEGYCWQFGSFDPWAV
jgi:uncharacterized glyoxalase superfamily protein PhnB